VTEEIRPREYWTELNRWLRTSGLGIIKGWAEEWLKSHPSVMPGEHAPLTAAKQNMVEEGYSAGQKLVADWLRTRDAAGPIVTTDKTLVELIRNTIWQGRQTDKLERDATVRKLAKAHGWAVGTRQVRRPGSPSRVHLISTDARLAQMTPEELAAEGVHVLYDIPVAF